MPTTIGVPIAKRPEPQLVSVKSSNPILSCGLHLNFLVNQFFVTDVIDFAMFNEVFDMVRSTALGLTVLTTVTAVMPPIVLAQATPLPPLTGSAPLPPAQVGAPVGRTPVLAIPAPAGYRLGAGDQIDVNVFDNAEVSGVRVVAPDGSITLPLVGKVPAAGRTTEGLAQDLRRRLITWFKNPIVAVNIGQFRPMRISVAGEVRRPGPIQMRNVAHDNSRTSETSISNPTLPTLSAALIAAGGVTRDGDISQVVLQRGEQRKAINLWQGIASENAPQDELLQDGDAIYVPKSLAGSPIDARMIARSTLAPATVRVRVVGEVKKPGEVDVTPNSSISSAIAIAGGPTEKARMEEVALVRLDANGQVIEQKMNLQKLQDSQQVLDGDVVIVPKSRTSTLIDVAGQVLSPLGVIFNLFKGGR
jgi:polysaccharide biosynthesis/export protein